MFSERLRLPARQAESAKGGEKSDPRLHGVSGGQSETPRPPPPEKREPPFTCQGLNGSSSLGEVLHIKAIINV